MHCVNCGKELYENAKFCSSCGESVTQQEINNKSTNKKGFWNIKYKTYKDFYKLWSQTIGVFIVSLFLLSQNIFEISKDLGFLILLVLIVDVIIGIIAFVFMLIKRLPRKLKELSDNSRDLFDQLWAQLFNENLSTTLIIVLLLSFLIFSGINSSKNDSITSYRDEVYKLENDVSELEDKIDSYESCLNVYSDAISEAQSNLENGYYRDAYSNLDIGYCR